jgi:hypothetical protein
MAKSVAEYSGHVVLFNLGKTANGLYIGNSSFDATNGAAGSLVVLLIWMFYSTQILLIGAEFTLVYARSQGRSANNDRNRHWLIGSSTASAAGLVHRSKGSSSQLVVANQQTIHGLESQSSRRSIATASPTKHRELVRRWKTNKSQ